MDFKRVIAIAACDPNGVLGKSGKLPWHYPEELQHFAETTRNHFIVMGFNTYLSLPKYYFEERFGIVFSRQRREASQHPVIFVNSLEAFLSLKCLPANKDIYLIGGAQLYTLFLQEKLIKELILTRLKQTYEGDTFFPLSLISDWPHQKIQDHQDFSIYRYWSP